MVQGLLCNDGTALSVRYGSMPRSLTPRLLRLRLREPEERDGRPGTSSLASSVNCLRPVPDLPSSELIARRLTGTCAGPTDARSSLRSGRLEMRQQGSVSDVGQSPTVAREALSTAFQLAVGLRAFGNSD